MLSIFASMSRKINFPFFLWQKNTLKALHFPGRKVWFILGRTENIPVPPHKTHSPVQIKGLGMQDHSWAVASCPMVAMKRITHWHMDGPSSVSCPLSGTGGRKSNPEWENICSTSNGYL
jgi:hypothetical protein